MASECYSVVDMWVKLRALLTSEVKRGFPPLASKRSLALTGLRLLARFLQCREGWLAELVAGLDESNAYDYLKRLTDVHRLQLFDVVMQYRAIFADDSSSGDDSSSEAATIVYSWAEHRV